jgi:hypothetical protein
VGLTVNLAEFKRGKVEEIGHISDLHVRDSYLRDQHVILDAFFNDLAEQHAMRKFDLIIFSGDLTFSGKGSEFDGHSRSYLNRLRTNSG